MNLDKLVEWAVVVVLAFAATGHLGTLQRWIWREQAKVLYASRASAWPTPRLWPDKMAPTPRSHDRSVQSNR